MGLWQHILYNRSTRRLRQMLESVRMRDFSLQYATEHLHGEERRMAEEINAVIMEFRETEQRREGESHFYDALLSKVEAMLIATDDAGRVRWMNRAAVDGLCGFMFESFDSLAALHPSLPQRLRDLKEGMSQLMSFTTVPGEERQYAASRTCLYVRGIAYRLYSLQSVEPIMRQGEMMAQQRLMRILTHEIMNSISPIASLSETLGYALADGNEDMRLPDDEIRRALEVISRRANGLIRFVERYRQVSGIAMPEMKAVNVGEFVNGLTSVASSIAGDKCRVCWDVKCHDAVVNLDCSQMEQVLINLLKNAVEAGATCIWVRLVSTEDGRWLLLSVEDNGAGIDRHATENVFTPFFSTKPEGQGIGLAVCRQIVSNHGGMIGMEPGNGGKGTRFTVRLPL
ncbi:MAG: HAMP domain-containing histidine kinase [Paraprevotella sp.]|nr:HAMP domain-containing histidine kinase [Paraprevotella sp.]